MDTPLREQPAEPPANRLLSLVLRGGVIVSSTITAVGLLLFLLTGQSGYALDNPQPGDGGADRYFAFHEIAAGAAVYFPTSLPEVLQGAVALKPFALIMLGLLLLIATPVLNVALAGWQFLQQGNRAFGLISLFVLAVLALSFGLGKAGG